MSYLYKKEKKKFDREREKLYKDYLAAGMTVDQIANIFQFDLEQLNRDIAFWSRTQPIYFEDDFDSDEQNPLLLKFGDALSCENPESDDLFAWMDNITEEPLSSTLQQLSFDNKLLLTLLFKYEYSQVEICSRYNIPTATMSRRCDQLLTVLRNCPPADLRPRSLKRELFSKRGACKC